MARARSNVKLGGDKNRARVLGHYGTQKFAPRRSELQLTVDFNDPPKQLQRIEVSPLVRGEEAAA